MMQRYTHFLDHSENLAQSSQIRVFAKSKRSTGRNRSETKRNSYPSICAARENSDLT